MGMPWAPVPPMMKILEVVWEDIAVDSCEWVQSCEGFFVFV